VLLEPAEQPLPQPNNALGHFLGQLAMLHREYLLRPDSGEQYYAFAHPLANQLHIFSSLDEFVNGYSQ
jgi:hypothetical protein